MGKNWWKILTVLLLAYTVAAGFLFDVPRMPILHETIRNLYFHVTMWFAMMVLITISVVASIRYLLYQGKIDEGVSRTDELRVKAWKLDVLAKQSANIALLFGLIGVITGSIWAKFTWGAFWVTSDPKLNGAALGVLMYIIYMVLRNSILDEDKRNRVAAVYNIIAFVMFMVFVNVIPRMQDSLHPGNGGNPMFGVYDLDNSMRMVFYPAIMAWTLLGI